MSLISYLIRFARWHWLLSRAGFKTTVMRGLLSNMAGFAFTATHEKVGELVRIRYLTPLGVPSEVILSAFIFERTVDLVVVLVLASLFVQLANFILNAAVFVCGTIAFLAILLKSDRLARGISRRIQSVGTSQIYKLFNSFRKGVPHVDYTKGLGDFDYARFGCVGLNLCIVCLSMPIIRG